MRAYNHNLSKTIEVQQNQEDRCLVCNSRELEARLKSGENIRFFEIRVNRSLMNLCEHHLNDLIDSAQAAYISAE